MRPAYVTCPHRKAAGVPARESPATGHRRAVAGYNGALASGTLRHWRVLDGVLDGVLKGVRTQGVLSGRSRGTRGTQAPGHPASLLTLAVCLFVHCVFVCDATDSSRRCEYGGDPLRSGADVVRGARYVPVQMCGGSPLRPGADVMGGDPNTFRRRLRGGD